MSAYCLFDNIQVDDPAALEEYATRTLPVVEAHGGRYVVVGGPFEVKEGSWSPTFPVLIEFPDIAAARDWYESPEYAPLKALREASGRYSAVFIEGASPPDEQP